MHAQLSYMQIIRIDKKISLKYNAIGESDYQTMRCMYKMMVKMRTRSFALSLCIQNPNLDNCSNRQRSQ